MDRKEFLAHILYGALLITGVASLIRGMHSFSGQYSRDGFKSTLQGRRGFGSGKFG
jgi:hypothetical protein